MNLEILMFAALGVAADHCGGCTQADRDQLIHIAETHANTSALHHVRTDGSIRHIVCYDPTTGAELFSCNGGGELDNTTWARGQAWAIYAYTMMYRYSRRYAPKQHFLQVATLVADFFLSRIDAAFPDHVPNFDLTYALGPVANLSNRDASAAAIAASGLLELAGYVEDTARQRAYAAYGAAAIVALGGPDYRTEWDRQEGAVRHCNAQDTDVPWADYYLLEAVRRSAGARAEPVGGVEQ